MRRRLQSTGHDQADDIRFVKLSQASMMPNTGIETYCTQNWKAPSYFGLKQAYPRQLVDDVLTFVANENDDSVSLASETRSYFITLRSSNASSSSDPNWGRLSSGS